VVLAKHEIQQGRNRRARAEKEDCMSAQTARLKLDVSKLPDHAMDAKAPLWWGNLLLLFIETGAFVILVASYFYTRMNFHDWPPPRVNSQPILYDTNPRLGLAFVNLAVILLSLGPTIWAEACARKENQSRLKIALLACIGMGMVAIALRFYEFKSFHFRWDENAYASLVWTILGMHLLHLLIGTFEFLYLASFAFTCPLDKSHALDVTVTTFYWYWVVGTWALLFILLYFVPRLT
jgi:cytochrome c oxidase subunit I+III